MRAKRLSVLVAALCVLAVALVACSTPANPIAPSNQTGSLVISTPNSALFTPTPQFPEFTVGAWPSNYSPNPTDTITIYVLCRVQDQSMAGPSTPPPTPITVTLLIDPPVNQQLTGTTDARGLAAIPVTINDPQVGLPVVVRVSASYKGKSYQAETFFTPGPTIPLTPTPAPAASTTPGAGVTPSPSTGP